jgi:hypothetical protein
MWVTVTSSKNWPSSLGDSVHKDAKSQIAILVAYLMLICGIPAAMAVEETKKETPTQTIVEVVDPLDKYRGATDLTDSELKDLLSLVGFEGNSLKVAWSVVMKESRGNPDSHNKTTATGDNSYGIFQINMIGDLGAIRREKFGISKDAELFDPVTNAQAAYYMTGRGTDFSSWGYGPGAYDGDPSEPGITKWFDDFPKN